MLTPGDQKHIDRCRDENNGICLYRHRTCDGVCNNCPMDAPEDPHPTCNGAYTTVHITREAYFNLPI